MKKKFVPLILMICVSLGSFGITGAYNNSINEPFKQSEEYGIQWEMNYGSDWRYGRYEGPQPIGDCDNDGKNELLIGGRDTQIRVMEWNDNKQTYVQKHTLRPPFYHLLSFLRLLGIIDELPNPGGFAIGDLTGDGKNEIAATWSTTVYKWIAGKYRIIGFDNWIFSNGGGSADCYIGDYDNDGRNELIVSGGPMRQNSPVPEIVIYQWNKYRLEKEAEWNDEEGDGYWYIYMPCVADVDEDGENELLCGSGYKVLVLDWNKDTESFDETIIKRTGEDYYPFAFICKDSDMDGKLEIHVSYYGPAISIFGWNGTGYEIKFEKEWYHEAGLIEALDVGDVDDDGIPEVCAGTNYVHILQWNGSTYIEEYVITDTYGMLAVVSVGDCDNDGKYEINAAPVFVRPGDDYKYWIFKYGWESNK